MKLKVISSGSEGNCYILTDSNDKKLILECGVSVDRIFEGMNHDINDVCGVLLTHEHQDHCMSANKLSDYGMNIITSAGTANAIGLKESYHTVLEEYGNIRLGPFMVIAFNTFHNSAEPLGFAIFHIEIGTLVFATDTSRIDARFMNVNHWLIESNYIDEHLENMVKMGKIDLPRYEKTKTHMELGEAIKTVKSNNLQSVSTVILCHLSLGYDEEVMKKRFAEETGIMPHIAIPNLEIEL